MLVAETTPSLLTRSKVTSVFGHRRLVSGHGSCLASVPPRSTVSFVSSGFDLECVCFTDVVASAPVDGWLVAFPHPEPITSTSTRLPRTQALLSETVAVNTLILSCPHLLTVA